jgi:hypothetical protein
VIKGVIKVARKILDFFRTKGNTPRWRVHRSPEEDREDSNGAQKTSLVAGNQIHCLAAVQKGTFSLHQA